MPEEQRLPSGSSLREEATLRARLARLEGELAALRAERRADHEALAAQAEALRVQQAALTSAEAERHRFWDLSLDLMDVASIRTGYIVRANPAWTRLLGWSEAELRAVPLFEFIHPDDRPAVAAVLGQLGQGVHLFDFECRMRAKDGTYRTFEWVAQAEGDLAYGYGRDVTDRRRTEELLARASEILPLGLAFLDARFVFQWVNPALLEIFGLAREQMLARSVAEVFPEAWEQARPLLEQVVASKKTFIDSGRPFVVRRHDQLGEAYFDLTFQPVLDAGGQCEGILALAQDVTDRVLDARRKEEQITSLRELDEAKDQFLGILSHELRTPINAIMGFGSVLDDEIAGALNEKQKAYLQQMLEAADDLLSLVNDLLDMSRIKAGKLTIAPQPTAIAEVSEAVLASFGPAAESKRMTLLSRLAPGLPLVAADRQRLAQVFSNLLGNALKFTPPGGRVEVRARVESDALRVEVADDGPGIAPEDLPKLFKPFSQIDMSNTRRAGGVGLGLTICKGLVEAHGGRIGVESPPGGGATFWFTVPIARPRAGARRG